MKEYKPILLVAGNPRSGTTALTRLLNLHPDLAIGMERFSRRIMRENTLCREDFDPERFRTYNARDCHPASFDRHENVVARSKIASARVVGDKLPNVPSVLKVVGTITDLMIVFILREPLGVAYSYQSRTEAALADPSSDEGWRTTRDYRAAVREFNKNIGSLARFLSRYAEQSALQQTVKISVVNWEQLFFGPKEVIDDLFVFTNVRTLSADECSEVFAQAGQLPNRARRPEIDRHVALNADYESYRLASTLGRIAA